MTSPLEKAVQYATDQVGDPYVWGAEGPDGFDCSGLLYAAYKAAGIDVGGRTTAAVIGKSWGAPIGSDLSKAARGDILYYDNPGPTDHVAIYLGGGQMVEAPQEGDPVRVTKARQPTLIRALPVVPSAGGGFSVGEVVGDAVKDAAGNLNPWNRIKDGIGLIPGVGDAVSGALGGAADALNPFDNWAADVFGLGMKLLAGGAAAALVIVGAREALNQRGNQ